MRAFPQRPVLLLSLLGVGLYTLVFLLQALFGLGPLGEAMRLFPDSGRDAYGPSFAERLFEVGGRQQVFEVWILCPAILMLLAFVYARRVPVVTWGDGLWIVLALCLVSSALASARGPLHWVAYYLIFALSVQLLRVLRPSPGEPQHTAKAEKPIP